MESSEAASRRWRCVASHLVASPRNSCSSSLATMVCSSGVQSSSRKDGRLLYARPNRHVPAYFKEVKDCEGSDAGASTQANFRKDNRLMFARQGCHTRAYFMREHEETQVMPPMERGDPSSERHQCSLDDFDVFNKASPDLKHSLIEKQHTDGELVFARPIFDGGNGRRVEELVFKDVRTTCTNSKLDWCPRMDITESKAAYVVTIELPGVDVNGIRVEVNNDRLLVSGARSMDLRMDNGEQNEEAVFHRRELCQGPFRAHWPIPKNSIIDSISAEFLDGFLRILVPKNAF